MIIEGKELAKRESPQAIPALERAREVGERLAQVGFDWPDRDGPRAKVDEELAELDEAIALGSPQHIESELGDLLLAVSNFARHLDCSPEVALWRALDRFEARFANVEELLSAQGRVPSECTLDELEELWQQVKMDEERQAIGRASAVEKGCTDAQKG